MTTQFKFKREQIKILGYDKSGVSVDATVAYLPKAEEDLSEPIKRYAWVITEPSEVEGTHIAFLEETPREGYFEPCIRVPMLLWTSFNNKFHKKLKPHQSKYLEHLIGSKIDKLRSTYDYNPLLQEDDSPPWWEKWLKTEKRKRKTRQERPIYFFRNINEELAPDEFDDDKRPVGRYLFRTAALRDESSIIQSRIKKSMRDKIEKRFEGVDMEQYYEELEREFNDSMIKEPEIIFLEN